MPPLVMKTFCPLMTQSPFLRIARVFIEETSEPASGSVTANAPSAGLSGVPKHAGIQAEIWSGVPWEKIAATCRPEPWHDNHKQEQPQDRSSATSPGMIPEPSP